MSASAVAERYAVAIFELGTEQNEVEKVTRDLEQLALSLKENEKLAHTLTNPSIGSKERNALLRDLGERLGIGTLAMNSVRVLLARHRLVALEDIAARLRELADEKAGVVRAQVTSAQSLEASFATELTRALEEATGKRVIIDYSVDPSLIAGIVTRIGNNTIDGSLAGRLDNLQQKLLQAH